jgi:hypothetical protein
VNPGLVFLLRASWRGRLRFVGRRMRTVKGATSTVATGLFLLLVVGSQVVARWVDGGHGLPREPILLYGPPLFLLMILPQVVTARGLHFHPAEIGFLFPAPVGRRELLAYQLASRLPVQALAGVGVAMYTARNPPLLGAGIAGVALALVFAYALAQWVALLRVRAERRLPPAALRALNAALVAVPAVALLWTWHSLPATAPVWSRVGMMAASPAVQGPAQLMRPFAELYAAPSALSALGWSVACAAMCAVAAALVLATDAPFEEKALVVSQKANDRLARMRSGRAAPPAEGAPASRPAWRVSVPRLAFLGRAEPLARRHLLEMAHAPRSLLGPLVLVAALGGGVLFAASAGADQGGPEDAALRAGISLAAVVLLPSLLAGGLRMDFRGDLDRMAFLKSLPLPAVTVAVGQLVPGTLLITIIQLVLAGAVVAVTRVAPPPWAAWVAPLLPVVGWCLLAVDNALFLLMPYRPPPPGTPASPYTGRNLLVMLLKMLSLAVVFGITGVAAWAAYLLGGRSPLAGGVAAAVALLGMAVVLTLGVGAAFAAFDVNRDVPA